MMFRRICILVPPVVVLGLFGGVLVGLERLAFRDVGHFYLPLYEYVAERTSGEWLPLWNPLDQTGIPLVGETTTAVLYPVRWAVFALPLSGDVALAWYVVLHLVLAAVGARWAAVQAGASSDAANLAGLVYPLSGGVLFLYANPPFLVGAAWLPLVLGALLGCRQKAVMARCLIAGPAMAMMILGGDPQTALHAMLVAGGIFVWRAVRGNREAVEMPCGFDVSNQEPSPGLQPDPPARGRVRWNEAVVVLLAVPVIAACLTAPQLVASLSWSRQSDRVHALSERAWYEAPERGSHRGNAFEFSLPPWHAASLLTPNALGRLFPVYQQISSLVPGDGRMWTPTIYLGALAVLAMVDRLVRRDFDVWMVIACVALLLCLGHFGVVWLLQQIPGVLPNADSAIGGPYWMLYQFLPGYDSFRYPAKWLPVFSLGAAIATALWIDRVTWPEVKRTALVVICLLVIFVGAAFAVLWQVDDASAHRDPFWGPLDLAGATWQLMLSLLHTVVVLAAMLVVLKAVCLRKGEGALVLLLLIVAVDLGLSDRQWVGKIRRADEQAITAKHTLEMVPSADRWIRTRRGSGWPEAWQDENATDRLLDVAVSERLSWFGRWHLHDRQAVLNNMTSIRSQQMAMFWQASGRATAGQSAREKARFWNAVRGWLGVDGVLVTAERRDTESDLVDVSRNVAPADWFRFHDQWRNGSNLDTQSFVDLLETVGQEEGDATPVLHVAVIAPKDKSDEPTGSVEIERRGENLVAVRSDRAGLLTRPVFQDGHWFAEVRSDDAEEWHRLPVYPVSFLKQGVILKPGEWEVRFTYWPWWLGWTLSVTAVAWVSLGVMVIRGLVAGKK